MPRSDDLLQALLAGGRRADQLTHVEHLPARPGQQSDWPQWVDSALVAGYRALGVERPWAHQAEAADAAWAGRHTAIATSTGSGKSLAFWLPALTAVRNASPTGAAAGRIETVGRRASVLYLCPTKALAADQLVGLHRLLAAAEIRDVRASTCDGDTPGADRRWIRDHADVVLTNPDFLHFALLPNHARWVRLLRGLRYVIVDEGHAFRGVFGAHVALVLRRLRRVVEHLSGTSPTFVLASATTADPASSAGRLIGVPPDEVTVVAADTSPTGHKTFALWEPPPLPGTGPDLDGFTVLASPPEGASGGSGTSAWEDISGGASAASAPGAGPQKAWSDPIGRCGEQPDEWWVATPPVPPSDIPDDRPRRSATAVAADLLTDLTAAGARTLAFTRSRRGAESVALHTQRELALIDPGLVPTVAAYRGGYLPEERRALEQDLRSGALRALATTNALELGVDIAGLDAVVIVGWPGTRMSVWQQAGRAGRAGADGLVVLIAREDPLDTFLVHHPEAIFAAPLEATVFDPTNPHVLAPHLCAAAAEIPLRRDDLPMFGPAAESVLDVLVARGALRKRPSGWYWTHASRAALLTDLRGSGGEPVRVVENTTGRLLGTVDASAADASVHQGAVYVHQGDSFVVDELDLDAHVAVVTRRTVDYGTWSRWLTSIAIHETRETHDWHGVSWGLGDVEVTTQVLNFQKRRLPGMEVLATVELDLPERMLPTTAVWWTVDSAVLDRAHITTEQLPGALHAAEHASIGLLPLLATCDRWDLGGVSTALHVDTERATVFVYDAYPGGAGFAERGFRLGALWLRATRDAIAECPCTDGCPACVQSPKCGNQNNPLDKAAALRLL
ncbi:MAG: DEAD/DEAH box helicase, partial [Cellulomonadaceae bacterium]